MHPDNAGSLGLRQGLDRRHPVGWVTALTILILVAETYSASAQGAISGFDPTHGLEGSVVVISGSGFSDATDVRFAGSSVGAGNYIVDSDSQITATVPAGATTGAIEIDTPVETLTSAEPFVVDPAPNPPTITGFDPLQGPEGAQVLITGSGFTGTVSVTFGEVEASFTVDSDAQIATLVPLGAVTAPITVSTPDGSATSAESFVVEAPPPPDPWIVIENERPGTSSWRIPPNAPKGISGYASVASAEQGDTVTLYVDTKARTFYVESFRLGYYQGLGGRLVWTSPEVSGIDQPEPTITPDTHMVEAPWATSLSVTIDSDWVEGTYLLQLVSSRGGEAYVPLVVRDDSSTADLVILHEVATWQAYNRWGGASLYFGTDGTFDSRSRVVSFDRPYSGRGLAGLLHELAFISLVEKDGLDVTYWTDIDLHQRPRMLTRHNALVALDHDEYWSTSMRRGAERARSQGVNLAFMGANAIYRHIRFEPSTLGPDRRIVSYKNALEDPYYGVDNSEVTVNWRQSPLNEPESALSGAQYGCNPVHADLVVSDPSSFVFAGTGLENGSVLPGAVDMEYDAVYPGAPTPHNVQILAHSPLRCGGVNRYADMTYYTAASDAGVFDVSSQGWYKLLACGAPVQASTCDPRAVLITQNVLEAFAEGPAGIAHPSISNVSDFGIELRRPTHP